MSNTKFNLPSSRFKVLQREASIETTALYSPDEWNTPEDRERYREKVLQRLIREEEEYVRQEQAAFEARRAIELEERA